MEIKKSTIDSILQSHVQSIQNLENSSTLLKIINLMLKARNKNKQIFVMGNGGSASTASHFTADLLKTALLKNQKRFRALSLCDNIPVISAWSNDTSYSEIFSQQIQNFASSGDLLIAFSGSGKSKNLIDAFKTAKKLGVICIGFSGFSGGFFPKLCDYVIKIPSNDMLIIESLHLVLCHTIISTIRSSGKPLFKYD